MLVLKRLECTVHMNSIGSEMGFAVTLLLLTLDHMEHRIQDFLGGTKTELNSDGSLSESLEKAGNGKEREVPEPKSQTHGSLRNSRGTPASLRTEKLLRTQM